MNQTILKAHHLTKRFGNITAVNDLNFEIGSNTIVALLGGNGAGKTTTMAMLLGLVIPSSGTITIFGEDFESNRYKLLSRMNFSSPYFNTVSFLSRPCKAP